MIHPLDFFARIITVASPSRPLQFSAYLSLISAFIFFIRPSDPVHMEVDDTWTMDTQLRYSAVARDVSHAFMSVATLLAEGIEHALKVEDSKSSSLSMYVIVIV